MEPLAKKTCRARGANFAESEKTLAFALFSKHSAILNNKQTDGVSQETKNATWRKVEQEFNASNTVGVFRNEKSLRKLFDNSIAKARKEAAITRKSRYRTGGGSSTHDQVNPLVLSFINSKAVEGLENDFDNDVLLSEDEQARQNTFQELSQRASFPTRHSVDDLGPQRDNCEDSLMIEDISDVIEADEAGGEGESKLLNEASQSNTGSSTHNWKTVTFNTAVTTPLKVKKVSKNGCRSGIRVLPSSDIAEKYNSLIDKRIAIADCELARLKNENLQRGDERNLMTKKIAVELQILEQKLTIQEEEGRLTIENLKMQLLLNERKLKMLENASRIQ